MLKMKTLNLNAFYVFNSRRFSDPAAFSKDAAKAQAAIARLPKAREELDAAETRWLELSERA